MAEERITDERILKYMGLTEKELVNALQNFNTFLDTLDAAQRSAFLHSLRSREDAADEIDDLEPARLEEFLRKYAPPGGEVFYTCTHRPFED
jgi:hypothetical protein